MLVELVAAAIADGLPSAAINGSRADTTLLTSGEISLLGRLEQPVNSAAEQATAVPASTRQLSQKRILPRRLWPCGCCPDCGVSCFMTHRQLTHPFVSLSSELVQLFKHFDFKASELARPIGLHQDSEIHNQFPIKINGAQ